MFKSGVLSKIFGPKRDKELYALYSVPNIIRVIKSRRLRWVEHVARTGERRGE